VCADEDCRARAHAGLTCMDEKRGEVVVGGHGFFVRWVGCAMWYGIYQDSAV
jgi:hypothetical protein